MIKFDPAQHAYVIVGSPECLNEVVIPSIETSFTLKVRGNPDVLPVIIDSFGIDDSRKVSSHATRRAVGGTQIFILAFNSSTIEAQNALLKTLEEPTPHTYLFIVVPASEILSPTVLSRARTISLAKQFDTDQQGDFARTLLEAGHGERLALIKKLVDDKDKVELLRLLDQLEAQLYHVSSKQRAAYTPFFYEIMLIRGYLRDRSPSTKILFEHLMLLLPVVPMEKMG